jgi:hypothetical protein
MFSALIDSVQMKVHATLRSVVWTLVMAAALFAAVICGAAVLFLWLSQNYGVVEAWMALGAGFVMIALFALIANAISKGRARRREILANAATRHSAPGARLLNDPVSLLKDPAMLLTGLQIVRIIGIRRILPLLLVGGVAAGFLLNRNDQADEPDYPAPAE